MLQNVEARKVRLEEAKTLNKEKRREEIEKRRSSDLARKLEDAAGRAAAFEFEHEAKEALAEKNQYVEKRGGEENTACPVCLRCVVCCVVCFVCCMLWCILCVLLTRSSSCFCSS